MSCLVLDCNKLLSIDDLCLVGLSKVSISIEPELSKKINLDLEDFNTSLKCNNINHSDYSSENRESLKSRMICCSILQQALRWKPRPNSLLITKLVNALNKNYTLSHLPGESRSFEGEFLCSHSAGVARMLSSAVSAKPETSSPWEVLKGEVGLSEEEFKWLTSSPAEVLSDLGMLGTLTKTLTNLSDLNMGAVCEALSVPYDFLLLPEVQKIPNVMETVRNLLWLTEDSKVIPKKGGDENVKSLVSSYLVLSGELRHQSSLVLKEVSKIFSSVCSNLIQKDLQNAVNRAWNMSLKSQVSALSHSLEDLTMLYAEILALMLNKYEDSFEKALVNQVEGLQRTTLEESLKKYEEILVHLKQRPLERNKGPSLSALEQLCDLLNDYTNMALCVCLNVLNLKELSDLKASEKKAKQNKQQGQKSILGHGNELYKNFVDTELCEGVKYCDHEVWSKVSRQLRGTSVLSYGSKLEELLVPQNQKTRLPKLAKGTLDFGPAEMLVRRVVINKIKDIFRQHGAVEIETPVFELKETLLGKYGEDQKLIFDLKDQGGEQLSMRYDLTVPFARFVAMNKIEKIKRFHIGKVYRRDEPQLARGRYREFYQCDVDWAGEYSKMVPDAEVIFILIRVLRMVKGGTFHVKVNHRGILDAILLECGVEESSHRTICSSIDKLDKLPWEKVKHEMVYEKGLPEKTAEKIREFIELKGTFEKVIESLRERGMESLERPLEEMELLASYLKAFGVTEEEAEFDLSLARGLDYYTGVIFEAVLEGEEVGSVGGGGRYDGLIGMFSGKQVPAVGMSVGIERLFRTMPKQDSGDLTDVFVCTVGSPQTFVERMKLCSALWREGIKAEYLHNTNQNLRKQMDAAIDKGVSVIVIVGDSELESNTVKVKKVSYSDQDRSEEISVERTELVPKVKSLLSQHTKYDHLVKALFKQ
ncbi:histidyl-tRNA synthetase [Theileria orientalis strain Shintoku]|uniref:Histidine--tRNA ligase, cytoplasmic n=1 Tax=Theileria orientalis strain Shintoku TaxID=869250 RepID=J7M876_THEOR|nr:histidyl-tRNA synthetase [Theileria orientalis strain Shintoku]BAM38663.1 histidyl-tRNA synthetase [Theileria orientalis strain Shintoku]|eukprot:XP_009688964.1 histidyl-tRNA synthetase [Theileria orientalis strain Shintoku]